jgi:hypothetical protein
MVAMVLLGTCRYLLRAQPGNLALGRLALQYKQACIQTLRQEISKTNNAINLMTVAKALALALDEVAITLETLFSRPKHAKISLRQTTARLSLLENTLEASSPWSTQVVAQALSA